MSATSKCGRFIFFVTSGIVERCPDWRSATGRVDSVRSADACVTDAGRRDGVRTDGHVGAPALHGSREEIGFWFHPAPVDAHGFEQGWTERHLAVSAALALLNANHHALAVDVADLELA